MPTLDALQYSEDRKGPWRLYIYEQNSEYNSEYHRGGQWFRNQIRYADEEITTANAHVLASEAFAEGREIRVCDGGDELVYHAKDGEVLYGKNFWAEVLAI